MCKYYARNDMKDENWLKKWSYRLVKIWSIRTRVSHIHLESRGNFSHAVFPSLLKLFLLKKLSTDAVSQSRPRTRPLTFFLIFADRKVSKAQIWQKFLRHARKIFDPRPSNIVRLFIAFFHYHFAGDVTKIRGLLGTRTILNCGKPGNDAVLLVVWYKGENPIYR